MLKKNNCSTIYGYYVDNPTRYGVIELDKKNNPVHIEEKPQNPKSNYCVTGIYFYPNDVTKIVNKVKRSSRGEYEITTLNNLYLDQKRTHITLLERGYSWLDTGTPDALNDVSNYVQMIEKHQGIKMACPEEIAYVNKWINKEKLIKIAKTMAKNDYGRHLLKVASGKILYAASIRNEK